MSEEFKNPGCELFEQAIKNYDQAFQAGLKVQEDAVKWLLDCTGKGMPKDWQKRWSATVAESLPFVQKRIEESLRLVEQNSRISIDLLKQAFDGEKPGAVPDAQARLQELWEASLQTLRTNMQATTQLNAKALEAWAGFFQKPVEKAAEKVAEKMASFTPKAKAA